MLTELPIAMMRLIRSPGDISTEASGVEDPIFEAIEGNLAGADARILLITNPTRRSGYFYDSHHRNKSQWKTFHLSSWDIARHQREEIVPLRGRIAEENLLRYNGMLIGVFELLADARSQIASVNGAIDALRDFWLAQADLDMALVGKPTLTTSAGPAMRPAEAGGAGH